MGKDKNMPNKHDSSRDGKGVCQPDKTKSPKREQTHDLRLGAR